MSGQFKDDVVKLLVKAINNKEFNATRVAQLIERPEQEFGDFAFPCFQLAKVFKKSPHDIAKDIHTKLKPTKLTSQIEVAGPYINFTTNTIQISSTTITDILHQKSNYGRGKKSSEKIVVEFPSPNTNKPLHLGHVRNMLLGQSLAKILEFNGSKVIQVNLNNDRGVHICKAMLAYKKWGNNKDPDKKSDHFVGEFYVKYSQEVEKNHDLADEVQEMLVKWENNDKEVRALWKKLNTWALKGFDETYKTFGIKHDKTYNESDHYEKGRDIVQTALKNNKLERDENDNIVINLGKFGLSNKVLLRADGTSVYMTQDLYLAKLKDNDFKMDKSIYIVGSEQILHFRQLFKILEVLNIYKGNLYHLAHGMIYLPGGKMKSREGKVVDADNIVAEITATAKIEVKKRHKDLSDAEIDKRAATIGVAALRFFILKYDPLRDFTFNPKESISFEGETGPYVQYAHARISSILAKHKAKVTKADLSILSEPEELSLIRLLAQFPEVVDKAANEYKPLVLARFLLDLAQSFNTFYHTCPILTEENNVKNARLHLILAVQQVIKNGLALLSIEAPDHM